MAIKLDMSKAYNWVSWPYLYILMRRIGFFESWIDMVHKHISSNWYSLLVKGFRYGLFKSEKGLKQGDPPSPLFILSAEFL